MNKKILIGAILAVALLTLVSFSNVVGYQSVKTSQDEIVESEFDFHYCKKYLFETIVYMSNNPEIRDLININYKPQRTLFLFRRNNVDLKIEHIELLYYLGLNIKDSINENKLAEFIENFDFDNGIFEKIDILVMDNEEVRDRIIKLNKLNNDEIGHINWDNTTVICSILFFIFSTIAFRLQLFYFPILEVFVENDNMIFYYLLRLRIIPMQTIAIISIFLYFFLFFCWEFYYYPTK